MPRLFDRYDEDAEPRTVECKRCGVSGLEWVQDDGKWTLTDHRGLVHKCDPARVEKLTANEFD